MTERDYEGDELELFKNARNWKAYLYGFLKPHLAGVRVLEVGAGLGGNVPFYKPYIDHLTFLEPDSELLALAKKDHGNLVDVFIQGTTESMSSAEIGDGFDAILYSDVLEHIEDSVGEIRRASAMLKPGGRLIIVVPAYPALFSEFDAAIGHFRRYTRKMLRREFEEGFPAGEVRVLRHLEALGVVPSMANKLLLRQSAPTAQQVAFWDGWIVPVSRYILDPLVMGLAGKSVIGVIQKPEA